MRRPVRPCGLIPARAGNTRNYDINEHARRAHPRSRGEHLQARKMVFTSAGSSPLARGTPRPPRPWLSNPGLIPARAGNTTCERLLGCLGRAHPRSRGEHGLPLNRDMVYVGSSPLARGTPVVGLDPFTVHGLIPARAGNTQPPWQQEPGVGAHPRSRGEHFIALLNVPRI